MGFFDNILGRISPSDALELDSLAYEAKDLFYAQYAPENQQTLSYNGFVVPDVNTFWTDGTNYKDKADKLTKKCAVSARCLQMRAEYVSSVPLKVTGSRALTTLLTTPNFTDLTWQNAWHSWHYQLSIGGQVFLYLDKSVPSRPIIQSLRQDLVANNVQAHRWEYNPAALSGTGKSPEMIFEYDYSGATTKALRLNASGSYSEFPGALIQISYYDPTSDTKGLAPADAALKSVDILLQIDDLYSRKFRSGGSKNGFFKWNQGTTDTDLARIQTQIGSMNPGKGLNVMPPGMDFVSAQMTFAELNLDVVKNDAAKDICTAFGVDATMLNQGTATHANLRGMDTIFYRNFVGPHSKWFIGQIEAAMKRYLDPNASIEVDETKINHVQDDLDDKMTKWAQTGVVTIDECRAVVGLAPLPNGEGKKLANEKPQTDKGTGLGQPEEKPGGPTAFNADSGSRGDANDKYN